MARYYSVFIPESGEKRQTNTNTLVRFPARKVLPGPRNARKFFELAKLLTEQLNERTNYLAQQTYVRTDKQTVRRTDG